MDNDTIISIIAIIIGIIIMAFPLMGVAATSVVFGLGFIFWGLILVLYAYITAERLSRLVTVPGVVIGILMIIFGVALIFDAGLFTSVLSIMIYIVGIFLILVGILGLIASLGPVGKVASIVGVVVGIIYIILGYIVSNPADFGFLIGLGILIMGAVNLLNH